MILKKIYLELVSIGREIRAILNLLEPKLFKMVLDGHVIFDPDNPEVSDCTISDSDILDRPRPLKGKEAGQVERQNRFTIDELGKLYLDGVELKDVIKYELKKSAWEPAELTITVNVIINQANLRM